MKLFDAYEAVRFPEENLILITNESYLYYIYSPENGSWKKHKNAGYDRLAVSNYQEICKEELTEAMHGVFPQKETDFLRFCHYSDLCVREMLDLLKEDYSVFMTNYEIYNVVHRFLLEADNCHKAYLIIREFFDGCHDGHTDNCEVLTKSKELCYTVLGRDIFKTEISIADNRSLLFVIMPVRVIDDTDTNEFENVAEMCGVSISLNDTDAEIYLSPFLEKYFDNNLEANRRRIDFVWTDDDGNEHENIISNFDWYLTHNFYTLDSVRSILRDISDTIEVLLSGRENEFTGKITAYRDLARFDRLEEVENKVEIIVDFYRRFMYRMEYMLMVGSEKGYNLISFMGP